MQNNRDVHCVTQGDLMPDENSKLFKLYNVKLLHSAKRYHYHEHYMSC